MTCPDDAHLALHGLRLKGFAETETVAELFGIDPGALGVTLKELADRDLARYRDAVAGAVPTPCGWRLTASGRMENDRCLAEERERLGVSDVIGEVYHRFVPLNRAALGVFTRWQVVDLETGVLNTHDDADYDAAVIADLEAIDAEVAPLLGELQVALDRFAIHRPRLTTAFGKITSGDPRYVTGAGIDSYHTVWFELHEDLLVTLGLDRTSETVGL